MINIFSVNSRKIWERSVLQMREEKNEIYIGGAAAIAGNVAKFCGKVTLMSMVVR